ncbi:MAG: hypothetical protein ABW170_19000 [Candidatus Thiodiazotropha sp. L084R]
MRYSIYLFLFVLASCFSNLVIGDEPYDLPPLHHPVEIPIPVDMSLPSQFPLGDQNELVCDTCHGIEKLEEIPLDEVNIDEHNFLHFGPYPDLTDFCYHCHEKQDHDRYNLHLMIDKQGEIDDSACIYCHTETPDPTIRDQANEMEFRLPKAKLCYGCHLKTPHLNALVHMKEPEEKLLELKHLAEKEYAVNLPLDEEGQIACITCHSPHQAGVIDPDTPAGRVVEENPVAEGIIYKRTAWSRVFSEDKAKRLQEWKAEQKNRFTLSEYQRVEKEILLRLPAKDGTLCLSCHEFED